MNQGSCLIDVILDCRTKGLSKGVRNATGSMSSVVKLACLLFVITMSLSVSGCGISKYYKETMSVDQTSAFQITDRDALEQIDLAALLVYYAPGSTYNAIIKHAASDKQSKAQENSNKSMANILDKAGRNNNQDNKPDNTSDNNLDEATQCFTRAAITAGDPRACQARNALQERILSASTERCNVFKSNLQRASSRNNFGLGVLATLAGTAGALVTGNAANYFSGASAFFSGVRAEYNQDYLANLAAYVIIDGIDKQQREVYEQIQEFGQKKHYNEYPVEAAIKDALYYHGLCSVMTGFKVAQDSIKEVENPGLTSSLHILAKFKLAQETLDPKADTNKIINETKKISSINLLMAGSYLGGTETDTSLIGEYDLISRVDKDLFDAMTELIKAAKGDDKLIKELGLDTLTPNTFAESKNFPTVPCRTKVLALLKDEIDNRQAEANANSTDQRAASRAKAEMDRTKIDSILDISRGLSTSYKAAGDAAKPNWKALLEKAMSKDNKDKDKDVEAFKAEFKNKPKLNETILGQLNDICNQP